jgi:CRISPR-associated protein Cmr5
MSGRPNLEQVRAKNAHNAVTGGLQGRGVENGDAISGFPALIVNNGLLATLAFSISKKDKGGYKEICDAIAKHLETVGLLSGKPATREGLRDLLVSQDSAALRRCTAEALAYLNYLKRFAKGEAKRSDDEE